MGAAARALAALEVAVRGRGAALARLELVGVHAEAHRASGLAPLEARVAEDPVQPFLLGLRLHLSGARDDERGANVRGDALAFDDRRGRAQVLDARIGARADEHLVELDI